MIGKHKILAICACEVQKDELQNYVLPLYQHFSQNDWRVIIYGSFNGIGRDVSSDSCDASVYKLINFETTDAVIIFGQTLHSPSVLESIISSAAEHGVPVAVIDGDEQYDGCLNIYFDGTGAFRELTEHLVDVHSFTKINCIAGYMNNPASERRLAVLKEVLAERGIPFDECSQLGYGNSYSVPTRGVLSRFIRNREDLPEAVVCLDDSMAITSCEYLSERGIRVPEDIAVTGFGGSEHEKFSFPRLTTCRCDTNRFAEFVYNKLIDAGSENGSGNSCSFPYYTDISESCGCKSSAGVNVLKSINTIYARMADGVRYDELMNQMLQQLTGENDNEKITRILKHYIQFDAYLCMNTDFCCDTEEPDASGCCGFTQKVNSQRFFFGEEISEHCFPISSIIPDPAELTEKNEPLMVTAIGNQQKVYGYMAAFAGDFKYSVGRMQRFIMNLYSCVSMYEKQHYLYSSNKRLQHIQNEIIHSFADLVESRDGATGQHIKRTGEYVRVLVTHLSKVPAYSEELTPELQQRIYAAAPLHDIGKIKISDIILNKPGRLTAEEFEIIKTHTLEGSEIIARTLTNIENEDYLKIANEMALYHHEKWDGSGYLYHLAGEEIPLCARIMAVVDVFDALTSKRVYKDAFSFDEAVNILLESRGTHFDPAIIDVFMSIKDEIYTIFTENADIE